MTDEMFGDVDIQTQELGVNALPDEAIHRIVALLSDCHLYDRPKAAELFREFADNPAFHEAIIRNPARIPPIVTLLNDRDLYVRSKAAEMFGKLIGECGMQSGGFESELFEAVEAELPRIIALLGSDSNSDTRSTAADLFGKLIDNPAFHRAIIMNPASISPIVKMLHDKDLHVRFKAFEILGELIGKCGMQFGNLESELIKAVEADLLCIIAMLSDSNSDTRSTAADLFGKLIDNPAFRQAIIMNPARISPIVKMLHDKDLHVRFKAFEILGELIGKCGMKFGNLESELVKAVEADLPCIIAMLSDSNSDTRSTAAKLFGKLIDNFAFHNAMTMNPARIPLIVTLLNNRDLYIRTRAAEMLGGLIRTCGIQFGGFEYELFKAVEAELPCIIALLSDSNSDTRSRAADLFGKLVDNPAFHQAITMNPASIPPIVTLLNNSDLSVRSEAAEVFGGLIEECGRQFGGVGSELSEAVQAEIPHIIALLSDSDSDARFKAAELFGKLVDNDKFCDAARAGVPCIIALLSDSDPGTRWKAAEVFGKLINIATFHSAMHPGILCLVALLSDSNSNARFKAAESFGKLVAQPVFHKAMHSGIPCLVELLSDGDFNVRSEAAESFGKLINQSAFHEAMKSSVPHIVGLLADGGCNARSKAAELFGKLVDNAAVPEAVKTEIPHIIALLTDSDSGMRSTAAELFGKLAYNATFHEAMHPGIPRIVELFGDSYSDVREKAAESFGKLIAQAGLSKAVQAEIPCILALLSHSSSDARSKAAELFGKLVHNAAFYKAMHPGIPHIVALLSDPTSPARSKAAESFGKLADKSEFHEAMKAEIPHIIALLKDGAYGVRSTAAKLFGKLVSNASFHEDMHPAIPHIVELLVDQNHLVRSKAAELFSKLIDKSEFCEAVKAEIPHIIVLLRDPNCPARSKATESFGKLVNMDEFCEAVKAEIPRIIILLSDSDPVTRSTGADLLGKIVDNTAFHEAIKPDIPHIVTLLNGKNHHASSKAAELLEKLVDKSAFQDSMNHNYNMHTQQQGHIVDTLALPDATLPYLPANPLSDTSLQRIIVAEAALHHIIMKEAEIAEIMSSAGPDINYFLQAGFNESLIERSVGHLQEILLFTDTPIPATLPIFEQLGKVFSPFPGIVWMPSGCQITPVFEDGKPVDRDSLFLSRTQRFHKDAILFDKVVLTPGAITFNQHAAGDHAGGDSGSTANANSAENLGRQGPSGSQGFAGGGPPPTDNKSSGNGPPFPLVRDKPLPIPPPDEKAKGRAYFDVKAKIFNSEGQAAQTHTLQTRAVITSSMEVGRTTSVQFQRLDFQGDSLVQDPLSLHFIRVVIDTQNRYSKLYPDENSCPTPYTDGTITRTHAVETNRGKEFGGSLTASAAPSFQLTGKMTQSNKATSTSQHAEYISRTDLLHRDGVISWGFTIRDPNFQRHCFFRKDRLPAAECEFPQNSSVPAKIQIEVASYWFSLPVEKCEEGPFFFSRWMLRKSGAKTTPPPPYYNFCHLVAVEIPPDMEETFNQERQEDVCFNMPEASNGKFTERSQEGKGDLPLTQKVRPANKKYRTLEEETHNDMTGERIKTPNP